MSDIPDIAVARENLELEPGVDVQSYNAVLSDIKDEDDMASDNDQALATQQSIKAYVDAMVAGGSGIILQVLQSTTDAISTISGGGFTTVLSQAITPFSTNSKILAFTQVVGGGTTGMYTVGLRIKRDTIIVGAGAPSESRIPVASTVNESTGYAHNLYTLTDNFLDSPNTTSEITYEVEVGSSYSTSNTFYLNRTSSDANANYTSRGMSKLILMEVAG